MISVNLFVKRLIFSTDEKVCPGALCEQPGEILRQLTGMKYLQGKDIYGSPLSNKRNQSWLGTS